jgi:hypothetical protein
VTLPQNVIVRAHPVREPRWTCLPDRSIVAGGDSDTSDVHCHTCAESLPVLTVSILDALAIVLASRICKHCAAFDEKGLFSTSGSVESSFVA